jgi:hypothetical protein
MAADPLRPPRRAYALPSLMLVLLIGGQLSITGYATVIKLGGNSADQHWRSWPFFDYPMYSRSAGPPVQTNVPRLFAEWPGGARVEVTPERMGLKYFAWRFNVLERVVAEAIDPADPRVGEFAEAVERDRDQAIAAVLLQLGTEDAGPPARLVVEREVYRLTDEGLIQSEQTQVRELTEGVDPGEPGEVSDDR